MKKYETDEASVSHENVFQDRTDRFPRDQLLRKHGYKIHARPKDQEPTWEKNGKLYSQRKALRSLDRREVADAVYLEDISKDIPN